MSTEPLSENEIHRALAQLDGWSVEDGKLARDFRFADFPAAMAFMVRVGFAAEQRQHHPDWTNVYNRVAVRLNTHDAGGAITQKDVDLARVMETLAG